MLAEESQEFIDKVYENPSYLLSAEEKIRYLLFCEDQIEELTESLQKLKQLTNYLDFPPILEASKKIQDLAPLELKLQENCIQFAQQDEKLETLLLAYNEIINSISYKFLHLDSLVSELEAKKKGK